MRDVLDELLAERFGLTSRPQVQPDTPEVVKQRQRVLAEMPADENPGDEQQ
jgi:hypothetical protein